MRAVSAAPDLDHGSVFSFSLMRGGLVYRLERRLNLIDDKALRIRGRLLAFICVTWVPIIILEMIRLWGRENGSLPPLYLDLGMNVRLLFAAPILIAAEILIDPQLRMALAQFERREITRNPAELVPILSRASRLISGYPGVVVDAAILAVVALAAGLGLFQEMRLSMREPGFVPALAWYEWVSVPLLQFLQLRWAWRFVVWMRILWGISKLPVQIFPTHPDEVGGLGFLGLAQGAFASLWIAFSGVAASTVAIRADWMAKPLKPLIASVVAFIAAEALLLVLPLAFFMPRLAVAKRAALVRYGRLSSEYVRDFDRKWIGGRRTGNEPLLGSPDIESLGELGSGFDRIRRMRILPIGRDGIIKIVVAGVLPFIPLAFSKVPLEEIMRAVAKLVI